MKGMKSASEYQYVVPPAGTYRTKIVTATDKVSNSGNSMLEIDVEIVEPEQFAGTSVRDWIGTDGTTNFGRMGKKKLRGIGVDVDASDDEIPDSVLASQILGREVWTTFKQEQRMDKSDSGKYDKPVFDMVGGQQVPRMQLRVDGYGGVITHANRAAQAPAQQQFQSSPAQQAAFQQQFAPQQPVYQQAPQQFAPQAAPQQQFQQAPAPQFPQFAGQNGAAVPPWMQAPAAVPGIQPGAETDASETKKRSRKS